jgi:hypothetical protein
MVFAAMQESEIARSCLCAMSAQCGRSLKVLLVDIHDLTNAITRAHVR